jgi:hypothetical protein
VLLLVTSSYFAFFHIKPTTNAVGLANPLNFAKQLNQAIGCFVIVKTQNKGKI